MSKKAKNITDRIKSINEACEYLGIDINKVPEEEYILIIIAAINDGWEPDYENDDQLKWRVLNWFVPGSGWRFAYSRFSFALSFAGSRLDVETEDKADYIGKNFRKEWEDYLNKTPLSLIEKYKK